MAAAGHQTCTPYHQKYHQFFRVYSRGHLLCSPESHGCMPTFCIRSWSARWIPPSA